MASKLNTKIHIWIDDRTALQLASLRRRFPTLNQSALIRDWIADGLKRWEASKRARARAIERAAKEER